MGYRLYRHVLDHAPADLTSGERLLLLVIADDANDNTRTGWPGTDLLTHRTGLSPDGITKTFRRLANRGLEVRVPISTDAAGRPIFAVRGRRTTYRVPVLPERADAPKPDPQGDHSHGMPGPQGGQSGGNARTTVPECPDHSPPLPGPQSGPSPQSPHSPHHARTQDDPHPADSSRPPKATKKTKTKNQKQPIDFVMDLGATETEAGAVITRLQNNHDIENWPGFLAHATANGSLQGHLDTIRNSRRRRSTVELCEDHTRDRRTCPWCPPAEQDQAS